MCKPTNTYWKYFQLFEASLELLVHIWVDGRKSPSFFEPAESYFSACSAAHRVDSVQAILILMYNSNLPREALEGLERANKQI